MLKVIDKPSCFEQLSNDHVFYYLNDGNGLYGYLAVHYGTDAVIHLEITRFSIEVYKHMMESWEWVKTLIRRAGCKQAVATGRLDNDKFNKLVQAFGFPEPTLVRVSVMEV